LVYCKAWHGVGLQSIVDNDIFDGVFLITLIFLLALIVLIVLITLIALPFLLTSFTSFLIYITLCIGRGSGSELDSTS
jgi:hypothetical protein